MALVGVREGCEFQFYPRVAEDQIISLDRSMARKYQQLSDELKEEECSLHPVPARKIPGGL
jgi:hypothetical protein